MAAIGEPIRLGLLGIGGYAQQHLTTLRTLQDGGLCRLAAVADPFAERHPETVAALCTEETAILPDASALLERDDIEAVFIATPIPLHAPQSILALRAGKHVYLEKPPCATLGEHAEMVQAQEASGKRCVVGFQMQASPAMRYLKRRMVEGALGDLQTVWAAVRWRRDDSYYNRSAWAGRFFADGQPVFDGPATNALAHVVHAALFLAGETDTAWANLSRVRGVLQKARPIESYDTAYLEAETTGGARVRLVFTHATEHHDQVLIRCAGTKGTAEIDWSGRITVSPHSQPPQALHLSSQVQTAAVLDFLRAVTSPEHVPFTTVQDTRAYLQMVNGVCQSSGGAASFFPAERIEHHNAGTPQSHYRVTGLDDDIAAFRADPAVVPASLPAADSAAWLAVSRLSPHLECR